MAPSSGAPAVSRPPFLLGHATHPQWAMAAALVLAQLRAQWPAAGPAPTLGLVWLSDHYAADAAALLSHLRAGLPEVAHWAGATAVGLAVTGAEYWDEPALAVLLAPLPVGQFRVFSGLAPLGTGFDARAALVHAEARTPELGALVAELAARTRDGALFGGLVASRAAPVQIAATPAGGGVLEGGLSGVAFGPGVPLLTRVTQGCRPLGPARTVTAADGPVVLALDGEPALRVLLRERMSTPGARPPTGGASVAVLRGTLAALGPPQAPPVAPTGTLHPRARVRHLIGLDPARQGVLVAEPPVVGEHLAFCERDTAAARSDLVRIGAEIRDELESADGGPRRAAGAVYVSCTGRGGAWFGAPGAELQLLRRALGEVPLAGFFAGGEIAGDQLCAYTGVLTVFVGA